MLRPSLRTLKARPFSTGTPDFRKFRSFFDENGFVVIPGFASQKECAGLLERMAQLVEAWDPEEHKKTVFRTDDKQETSQGSSDYFLDSAAKIHFFLEPDAADEKSALKLPKHLALNKVGHGLHIADDVFRAYSMSPKIGQLAAALGWKAPVLPQSMYIFKQPRIGEVVTSHQDSCFLYTTPRPTCVGFWLALHDATLSNGCLWARPGSHTEPVRKQFVRNPNFFKHGQLPMMVYKQLQPDPRITWEGTAPDDPTVYGFKAVPCKAGDLFVIHGSLDHMSLRNSTDTPRHTFQLHLVEGPKAGTQWSPDNWQQFPPGMPLPEVPMR
jgi:phytanoyl-CoA hydroxylase